jgi:hypothetical protein
MNLTYLKKLIKDKLKDKKDIGFLILKNYTVGEISPSITHYDKTTTIL